MLYARSSNSFASRRSALIFLSKVRTFISIKCAGILIKLMILTMLVSSVRMHISRKSDYSTKETIRKGVVESSLRRTKFSKELAFLERIGKLAKAPE